MKKVFKILSIFIFSILSFSELNSKNIDKYVGKTFYNKLTLKSDKFKDLYNVYLIEIKINKKDIEIKKKQYEIVKAEYYRFKNEQYNKYEKSVKINKYNYKILGNKIVLEYNKKETKNDILSLEFKDDNIIANIKGTAVQKVFGEKIKLKIERLNWAPDEIYHNMNKMVDSYKEAEKVGLVKEGNTTIYGVDYRETINTPNSFYDENAIYLFEIGGGCFTPDISELSAEIDGETVYITWKEPAMPCPQVGKHGPFMGKIIFNKAQFPNYKKFKFVYQYM